MKKPAADYVSALLVSRLKRAKIRVTNPAHFFAVEAGEPQGYPGGYQVRVKTWRFYSNAMVKFFNDTGELFGYTLEKFAEPPVQAQMTGEEADQMARTLVSIPADAELLRFQLLEYAPGCRLPALEYRHIYQGLPVDGDYLRIVFHPGTRRIVEYDRKWRVPRVG